MARKTSFGTYLISASEIGSYTVCPEAWRLKVVARVKSTQSEKSDKGRVLHQEWADRYYESVRLLKFSRIIVLLLLLTISIYILSLRV